MEKSSKPASRNIVWHHATVTRERRERLQGHRGAVLWFTGLPASGKSTIAHDVEERLHELRCRTFVLDGDNVRHGLCGDLGFADRDREENIRRVGEVAKLLVEAGTVVLTAFVSPFRRDRERARALLDGDFLEVFCRCPVETCEQRDPKGHYALARLGTLRDFTGVSAPYEEPANPELIVDTAQLSVDESAGRVLALLRDRGVIA